MRYRDRHDPERAGPSARAMEDSAVQEHWRHGPTLLASLWRYRVVVVLVTFLAGAVGYAVALQQPPSYDATARLYLEDPGAGSGLNNAPSRVDVDAYVPQQAARATSRIVLREAVDRLDGTSLDTLDREVQVTPVVELLLLDVTASGPTAETAAERANAVAQAYRDVRERETRGQADQAVEEIDAEIEELEQQVSDLNTRLQGEPDNVALANDVQALRDRILQLERVVQEVQLEARITGDGVDLYEAAVPPGAPARPSPRLSAAVFALLGAAAAAMWAYWRAARTQRVTSRMDPADILGVPLLGEIPLYEDSAQDDLTRFVRPHPAVAEAYEFVLSSVEFALAEQSGNTLLVTSALPSDGKTSTVLQLAIAASRDGRKVVLLDSDIRARGLSRVLRADDRVGLSELATSDMDVADVTRQYRFSNESRLPVVTAGRRRGDTTSLLRTNGFRKAVQEIRSEAELLIVDSSPLLAVADATIVAGSVDAIVLVVNHGTLIADLQRMRERLVFVSTPVLGYLYNRSPSPSAGGYGYGYGYEEPAARRWSRGPRGGAGRRDRNPGRDSGGDRVTRAD